MMFSVPVKRACRRAYGMTSFYLTGLCLAGILLLAGCAGTTPHLADKPARAVTIGPYPAFSGRLIVIETTKRWQVLLNWQAQDPQRGQMRITHAATGTVVELRWQGRVMQVRDNRQPDWREIGMEQLSDQGIVIAPQELASILLGHMPAHFKQKNEHSWESHQSGSLIRLLWKPQSHTLIMTDM